MSEDLRWTWALRYAHDQAQESRSDTEDGCEDGYTVTALPITEAECAWLGSGLIWSGYSARDQREIVDRITAGVVSLLRSRVEALADELDNEARRLAGYTGQVGVATRIAKQTAAQRLRRSLSDNKEQQ